MVTIKMAIKIKFDERYSYRQVVYKITFDDKIYVGCTNCFARRMASHQYVLNTFHDVELLPAKFTYYCHIISYIKEYNIMEAQADILEEVDGSRHYLLEREEYWIRNLDPHYRLLNYSQLQLFSPREIAIIEEEMKNGIYRLIPPGL